MDAESNRREYMENQFQNYCIEYTRISGDKFKASSPNEWINLYEDGEILLDHNPAYSLAHFANHIFFLKEWLNKTDDNLLVLMEDDYDLSLIDYWHFDWNYLMARLPFDWDTVQLGYEHFQRVEFFLSQKDYRSFNFGPTLINRPHVKKILDLYLQDGKIISRGFPSYGIETYRVSVDFSINHVGKNYTIPLITTNTDFFQPSNSWHVYKRHHTNRYIYHHWWKNKRDQFTLSDFFTINKQNNNEMTEYLQNYASRALSF